MAICDKKIPLICGFWGWGGMEVLEALDNCCVHGTSHAINNYN